MSAFYCLDTLETKCAEIREKNKKKSKIKSKKRTKKKASLHSPKFGKPILYKNYAEL